MKHLFIILSFFTFSTLFTVEENREVPLIDPNKTTYCYLSLGDSLFERNNPDTIYDLTYLGQVGLGVRSMYSTEHYIDTIDCNVSFHNFFMSKTPLKVSIFPQISFLSHFWARFPKFYAGCGIARETIDYKKLQKEYIKGHPVKYMMHLKSISFVPCFIIGQTTTRTSTFIEFIELKMYLWESNGCGKFNPFINLSCNFGF